MKARSICASTLVAILGVTVFGTASPAFAAPTELTSGGSVIVEEGGTETSPGVVDPEKPGEVLPTPNPIPGETVNPDNGPLMIERVASLDFGTIKTSANAVTSYAAAASFGEGETATKRGVYMQWRDIRAGGTFGYEVTAQLTQQFTGKNGTKLTGATIDYGNGFVSAQGDNTNAIPSNIKTSFQLTEDGAALPIVNAAKTTKEGKGRYTLAFGKTADSNVDKSVKLTVPAATASNMAKDEYTAKVTWKITAAPTGEETQTPDTGNGE